MIKKVEILFRTLNDYILNIINYIETRQTVKGILEKYPISDVKINLINSIFVCFLDLLIMIIAICLTARIISTMFNIVRWIFHSNCNNDTNENNCKNKCKNCKRKKKKVVYRKQPVLKKAKKIKIPHFRKKSKKSIVKKLFWRKKDHNSEVLSGNASAKRYKQDSQQYDYKQYNTYEDTTDDFANQKNAQVSTDEPYLDNEETCYTDTMEINAKQIRQQVQQQKKS